MTLRCPVCRGHLSASDTIEEIWLEDEDAWEYRYACVRCLSVIAQCISEISERRPRPVVEPPTVHVASSVVARTMEQLRRAIEDDRGPRALAAIVAGEARAVLRIPTVFDVARHLYGRSVRLAEPATYRRTDDIADRPLLSRYRGARHSGPVLVLAKGELLRVIGHGDNVLRVVIREADFDGTVRTRSETEAFAPPDLVIPDELDR